MRSDFGDNRGGISRLDSFSRHVYGSARCGFVCHSVNLWEPRLICFFDGVISRNF